MNNVYKDVFDIELSEDEVIAKIAFEKLGAKKEEKVIIVEGEFDARIYKTISKRIKNFYPFFIPAGSKKYVINYIEYDDMFAIIDRDFDKNEICDKNKKVFCTRYANIEADLIDVKNIEEYISTFNPTLEKYKSQIKLIELLDTKVYKGEIYRKKIKQKFKRDWLMLKSETDFLNEGIYVKSIKKQKIQAFGDGIHCAKTLLLIEDKMLYDGRKQHSFNNRLMGTSDRGTIMKNLHKIHNFK